MSGTEDARKNLISISEEFLSYYETMQLELSRLSVFFKGAVGHLL